MTNGALQLVGTSLIQVGSNIGDSKQWNGGQGVLVIAATVFAPIVNLMFLGQNGVWIKMNTSVINANAVMPFMLPAGTYRIESATGSSVGLYATLCPTP